MKLSKSIAFLFILILMIPSGGVKALNATDVSPGYVTVNGERQYMTPSGDLVSSDVANPRDFW